MNTDMMRHNTSDRCVNCFHDKSVCEQLKGCIVENDKNLDDEQETLKRSYEQGRADGYSQAETDYHKQTENDRYTSYDCGYEQGRAAGIKECIEIIIKIMPGEPYIKNSKHYENWKMKTTELRMVRDIMLDQLKEHGNE